MHYITLQLQLQLQLRLELPLHYTTLRCTTRITRHCNCNYTTLKIRYARLHHTIPHYSTQRCRTLHYTNCTTPQLQLQLPLHYTNYTTLQLQLRRYTTLQIQPQLRYTTLHPVVMRDRCNHCSHSKNTTPTTFRPISGFALPSVIHNNQPYRFPIFESSATALCGTGIPPRSIAKHGIYLSTILFSDSTLQRWFRRRPSCGTDGSPSKFCGSDFFHSRSFGFFGMCKGTGDQKPAQGLIFGDGYNTSLDQVTWNMVIPRWLGNHWRLRAGKNIERSKWGIYSMAATFEYRRTTMFWY